VPVELQKVKYLKQLVWIGLLGFEGLKNLFHSINCQVSVGHLLRLFRGFCWRHRVFVLELVQFVEGVLRQPDQHLQRLVVDPVRVVSPACFVQSFIHRLFDQVGFFLQRLLLWVLYQRGWLVCIDAVIHFFGSGRIILRVCGFQLVPVEVDLVVHFCLQLLPVDFRHLVELGIDRCWLVRVLFRPNQEWNLLSKVYFLNYFLTLRYDEGHFLNVLKSLLPD